MYSTALMLSWLVPLAQGASGMCSWTNNDGWPPLKVGWHGAVAYERAFSCPGQAEGEYEVIWKASYGGREVAAGSNKKGKVRPDGRWDRQMAVNARTSNRMCDLSWPLTAKHVTRIDDFGYPRAFVPVAVKATFRGTGDLKRLNGTVETTGYCRKCTKLKSGSISMKEGRAYARILSSKVRILVGSTSEWFRCARQGSTLAIRYFVGDAKSVEFALRPDVVQSGLEDRFRVRGDDASFELTPPMAKLCRKGGSHVAWEAWGKGELGTLNGSRRQVMELRCGNR